MITSNKTLRGTDRYILQTLKHLAEIDKINQYFVFYAHWQKFVKSIDVPNFKFIKTSVPRGGLVIKAVWQILVMPKIARQYNLDVLHYTNPTPILYKTCSVVVTVHDLAEFVYPKKYGILKGFAKRISVRLSAKYADFLITVSNSTRKTIVDLLHYAPDRIGITLEGITVHERNNCEQVFGKFNIGKLDYILYVGVIEQTKQVDLIVKALNILDKTSIIMVIVGKKGNAYEQVKAVVKECGLEDRVMFLGYVSDGELGCIYKMAKVFVFPSLIEGFGLPVLEAMAQGVPVICSNTAAISEVAGDGALFVDPRNVEDLAEALNRVLEDGLLREKLINRGRAVTKNFSWHNTAIETLKIYEQISL